MKNTFYAALIGLLIIISFTGCDKRKINVPTDPADVDSNDAKWVLAFAYDTDNTTKSEKYYIQLYCTEEISSAMQDYDVNVIIGDSLFQMTYANMVPFFEGWSVQGSQRIPDYKRIVLRVNDNVVLNTHFDEIYTANAAFPATYDYQQPLTLNWALAHNNGYQFVSASSWDQYTDEVKSVYSSYTKQIQASQSSYTFPANCVSLVDGDSLRTGFSIGVEEVNYKVIGNCAVMVYQNEFYGYIPFGLQLKKQSNESRIMDIYHRLNK